MGDIVINNFKGMVEAIQPRLIADKFCRECINSSLKSGAIVPLKSLVVDTSIPYDVIANPKSAYYWDVHGTKRLQLWDTLNSFIESPVANDTYDRIYYTGAGALRFLGSSDGTTMIDKELKIPTPDISACSASAGLSSDITIPGGITAVNTVGGIGFSGTPLTSPDGGINYGSPALVSIDNAGFVASADGLYYSCSVIHNYISSVRVRVYDYYGTTSLMLGSDSQGSISVNVGGIEVMLTASGALGTHCNPAIVKDYNAGNTAYDDYKTRLTYDTSGQNNVIKLDNGQGSTLDLKLDNFDVYSGPFSTLVYASGGVASGFTGSRFVGTKYEHHTTKRCYVLNFKIDE